MKPSTHTSTGQDSPQLSSVEDSDHNEQEDQVSSQAVEQLRQKIRSAIATKVKEIQSKTSTQDHENGQPGEQDEPRREKGDSIINDSGGNGMKRPEATNASQTESANSDSFDSDDMERLNPIAQPNQDMDIDVQGETNAPGPAESKISQGSSSSEAQAVEEDEENSRSDINFSTERVSSQDTVREYVKPSSEGQ